MNSIFGTQAEQHTALSPLAKALGHYIVAQMVPIERRVVFTVLAIAVVIELANHTPSQQR